MGLIAIVRDRLSLPGKSKGIRGRVVVEVGGRVEYETTNLFVNDGYGRVASWMAGLAPAFPGYMAVGNGDGSVNSAAVSPTTADHTLGFEVLRKAISSQSVQLTYTVRMATTYLTTEASMNLSEVGLFDSAGDNGTASAGASSTLTDSSKTWSTNQWANYTIYITGGTGRGQSRVISSNTGTVITVGTVWATNPDATSTYCIGGVDTGNSHAQSKYMFARAPISVQKGSQAMNVIWLLTQPAS